MSRTNSVGDDSGENSPPLKSEFNIANLPADPDAHLSEAEKAEIVCTTLCSSKSGQSTSLCLSSI